MATSIHAFLFHRDGTLEPVSETLIHDHRADRVELPEHAGEQLRYAIVRVEIRKGEALRLTPMWCGILHFDDRGRQDRTLTNLHYDLTAKAARGSFQKSQGGPMGRVVDARGRFARRQLHHQYAWTPTETDLEKMRHSVENCRGGAGRFKPLP